MNARARTIAALGSLLLLGATPAAHAEIRTGSTPDPAGDNGGGSPARDIRAMEASYDTTAGTVTFRLTLGEPATTATAAVAFGFIGSAVSGGCGYTTGGTPTTRLIGGTPPGSTFRWNENAGTPTTAQPAQVTFEGATITATVTNAALAGRDYTCVALDLVDPASDPQDPTSFDSTPVFSVIPPATTPTPPPPTTSTPPPTTTTPPTTVTPPSPDADAPAVGGSDRTKKGKASGTVIYGICGKDLCRVDPRTRRLTRLYRARGKDAYEGVSASPSGATLAFDLGGDIFRAGRDGRNRAKIGSGLLPGVSPDGRTVAWIQYITVPSCFPGFDFVLQCTYPLSPSLQRRALGEKDSTTVQTSVGSFAWYRSRTFLAAEDPDEGEADFICELKDRSAGKDEGECARPVAVDPARLFSSPATSPDGRYLAVVSEPVPANAGNAVYKGRIALFSPATGKFIRNLTTSRRDEDPIFSPDGKTVAFNRGKDLLTVPTRGGAPKLVKRNMLLTGPSWAKRR